MKYLRPMTVGKTKTAACDFAAGDCGYERRADERFNYYLPMHIRSICEEGRACYEYACTVNISAGGVYFFSNAPWRLLEACEVTIWQRGCVGAKCEKACLRRRGVVLRIEELRKDKSSSEWQRGVAVGFAGPIDIGEITPLYLVE